MCLFANSLPKKFTSKFNVDREPRGGFAQESDNAHTIPD
jgi:hypothetical protein